MIEADVALGKSMSVHNHKVKALKALLKECVPKNPADSGTAIGVSPKHFIPDMAERIARLPVDDYRNKAKAADLREQLKKLHKLAREIMELDKELPWREKPWLLPMEYVLLLAPLAATDIPVIQASRGAPSNNSAMYIAKNLATYYQILTGNQPTSHEDGRYLYMLKTVYKILGVKASADHYAKVAVKWLEKNSRKLSD